MTGDRSLINQCKKTSATDLAHYETVQLRIQRDTRDKRRHTTKYTLWNSQFIPKRSRVSERSQVSVSI